MSRGAEGLVALNAVFVLAGFALLWASAGLQELGEFVPLAGPALLLGAAAVGLLGSFQVELAGGISTLSGLALGGIVVLSAGAYGRRRGRVRLRRRGSPDATAPRAEPWLAWLLAGGSAVFLLLLLALVRLQPVIDESGWVTWLTRAKAIAFADGNGGSALAPVLGRGAQPLFVPALQALVFDFGHSPDPALVSVEYWVLLTALLLSVAGLLRSHAPAWLCWLFVALTVLSPRIDASLSTAGSELPLAVFVAATGLLLALWVQRPRGWLLAAASLTLAAALAASVEGQLLAACVLASGLLAVALEPGRRWLRLLVAGFASFATLLPFWLWAHDHHLRGALVSLAPRPGAASAFGRELDNTISLLCSYHLWLAPVPLVCALAVVLLVLSGPGRGSTMLALGTIVLSTLALVLMRLAGGLQPARSASGFAEAVVLFALVLGPLLVSALLSPLQSSDRGGK